MRKADQSSLEQGEPSLPEDQGTPDEALSEGHCSTEPLLPEGHCSTRIYSMKHCKAKENIKPKAQEQYEKATRAAKKQEFERQKKRARRNSKALPTQENGSVQNAESEDSQKGQIRIYKWRVF